MIVRMLAFALALTFGIGSVAAEETIVKQPILRMFSPINKTPIPSIVTRINGPRMALAELSVDLAGSMIAQTQAHPARFLLVNVGGPGTVCYGADQWFGPFDLERAAKDDCPKRIASGAWGSCFQQLADSNRPPSNNKWYSCTCFGSACKPK